MNTLLAKAWFLICSALVSGAATELASLHHEASHHGDSTPQKIHQNTIVPFGIQIPEHVFSTQDVACISADNNIFEIMNKASESCNGTDLRCTFYHFINHDYQNIGTLDIDKERFDDLLMKFDNWLLTAENIEKDETKGASSFNVTSVNVNDGLSNEGKIDYSSGASEANGSLTNHDKLDHNTNESDDDVVHSHHMKSQGETHQRNHHHKGKNGHHVKLDPVYNKDHRYFEVFLPKDKESGKQKTIYVEVDTDKNEFVLLDEEIDKKLNGVKPIKIELDELSEIADTAFNNVAKSSNYKKHIYNQLNDDERNMTSDINTYYVNEDEVHLDIDIDEHEQNILNPSVCNPSICNINATQQLISDDTTGNVKKIVSFSKNLIVPNTYLNHAQFYVESRIDNTTDDMPKDHLEILESNNIESDLHTDFYEEEPLDTIEFYDSHNNTEFNLDNMDNSCFNNTDIRCKNDDDNSTENYELSTEHENVTFDDDSFIQLDESNDTCNIDLDNTYDTVHVDEPSFQVENPVQENKLKSTPNISSESELTSFSIAEISDYTGSQLETIPAENREGHTDLQDHDSVPSTALPPYTTVPILGKDLAKVLETDSYLESSFPAYAILDSPAATSKNTLLNDDFKHPAKVSYNSPLDSRPNIYQYTSPIFPTPPVECVVRLNKGSKYSPLNFGVSWLPSYSRIEELRLPCALNPLSSPQDSIFPLPVPSEEFFGSSLAPLDYTITAEDPSLLQTVPSLGVDVQDPSFATPFSPKHVLPSTLYVPKSINPLSVMPNSLKDCNSPCPFLEIPSYLQSIPNLDHGFIKYSPFDNISKETMIPCSPNRNIYPYPIIPYFVNPHLTPSQYIPPYVEPLFSITPLHAASKKPTPDLLPLSLDQSNPCLSGDYPLETKPISLLPLAPNTPFSPLNPLLLGPGFVSNKLTCPNLLNTIPYLPYTVLSDQNTRNYPAIVSNYLTPSAGLQQNQILKPLLSKAVPSSALEQPCPSNNILEITPLSYAPSLPVQMELSPSLALERDLQSLSLKYGIPLAKILNTLETEISDTHSKIGSPTLKFPSSNLTFDNDLISKQLPTLPTANEVVDDENRSGNEELLLESDFNSYRPLDSSPIGPYLEKENSQILDVNDSSTIQDSSLIGPHLSTLSTSNFQLSDENRIGNDELLIGSDISNLSPLDASLIGPHLEIGSPPVVLESNHSQGDILLSLTEAPHTPLSQIEPKLNLQNQPISLVLDSSLIGSHLPILSPVKPSLSKEHQSINEITLLESDLTDLTPIDSSHVDLVNELKQSEILQHGKSAVTLSAASAESEIHESLLSNSIEGELLLESDSSSLIPIDSSLIGPELKLGSLPIITDSAADKIVPLKPQEIIQNTDIKVGELENIILPSSLLPKLLGTPVKADLSPNTHKQDTKLNEELGELSIDTNTELTDISVTPFKETDFKIVEPVTKLPSLDNNIISILLKDSATLKHNSKSSDTVVVDSETQLDSSLSGPSFLHKIETPEISSTIDSSIQLDSSLIGPSLLQEIEPSVISPTLDSESHPETSLVATIFNQSIKPSEILTAIDSEIQLDSTLIGPSLHQDTSNTLDSVPQLDSSLVMPSLIEPTESSATLPVFESSHLDSSLIGPSLKPEMEVIEVSRVVDSKSLLDSSLVGPHLTTVPFSSDEIKMINKELLPDSSLIGPNVGFESQLGQSDISRYQKPELSLTSEPTDFLPSDSIAEELPLESDVPSIGISDLQELLSKFTNPITVYKSHLSPSEVKPCDKLLSSLPKKSSNNIDILPSSTDLQTLTLNTLLNTPLSLQDDIASAFSPTTLTVPEKEVPMEYISNYFPTPETLAELPSYVQRVPQIPIRPYSPFIQMKPIVDRNWLTPPLNIQNILPASVGIIPVSNVVETAPVPFTSNTFVPITSEAFKTLLDSSSQSKPYPQSSISNMYTSGEAIASPSSECTTPSSILPLGQYIPLLPKKTSVLPSNLEYNPIVVDDIMSLLDKYNTQLLKDMTILPFSESEILPSISKYEEGELVSPPFLETRPVLSVPIPNSLVPTPIYANPQLGLYNPQNIPYMTQTLNILPCNLHPYSSVPLKTQFSEIIGPAPELISLPTESPKTSVESQLYEISNMPQLIESVSNPILGNELLQELLSKSCLDSSIVLPSSSLDTKLQLPTAFNELNTVPSKFIPISPIYTDPLSNVFTNPILPSYASPSSVSYAKPISTSGTSLPLNIPYSASPLLPDFTSPLMFLSTPPLSNYSYLPTVLHNRPLPSAVSFNPSEMYSSPYLPVPGPLPNDTFISKTIPAMTSPESPPLSAPYFSPVLKTINNIELPAYSGPFTAVSPKAIGSTHTGLLSPSYFSPDTTSQYLPLPAPLNTLKRPTTIISPTFLNPISPEGSSLLPYNRLMPSNSIFTPELSILRPINTPPISYVNNPFLNANKLPIQSYPTHSKSTPYSNSQLKQNIPYGEIIETNLETSPYTEETPYDVVEENTRTYSNDKDDKYYEDPNSKYLLQSLSYTLASDENTETLPDKDLETQKESVTSVPVTSLASELAKLYQRPQTPDSLHGKPLLRPSPAPQLLPPPPLMETIPPNTFDNTLLVPFSSPLKSPVSLPTSILYSPLLRPLASSTPAPILSMPPSLVSNPLIPILPMNEKPFISSPYYSTPSKTMLSPPIDLRELKNILTPQVPTNAPFVPISSPMSYLKSQPPTSPYIPENYVQLPPAYNEPKSKPLTSQGSLVKPYAAPIISHIPPTEIPMSPQYITPLSPPQSTKKTQPLFTPHPSSILPAQTTLLDSLPLNEAPIHYQPYIPQPTGLTRPANNIFRNLPVALLHTVSPSVNNMVKPVSSDLNSPQWCSLTPQYSLPSSTPVPLSNPIVPPFNVPYSGITPQITKQALANHIIPSSLFLSSDTDFQTPANKISLLQSIPRYSSPSLSLIEPLEIAPYVTPNRLLGKIPQNLLKPETQFSKSSYTVPLSSSSYLTQPLKMIDSYQTQPHSDVQHTFPKFSAVKAQYASPYSSPIYTSLPLETTPNPYINKPCAPQYSLSGAPVHGTPIHSSPVGRNPFLNSDFKPILEVASYPVPDYHISSPKLTPDSILLSNLRPLDIPQEFLSSYSSPMASSVPISSPSLLKPLAKTWLQKLPQYHLPIIPSNSQYVSQLPMDNVPELLPSTSTLLKSPLLKPLGSLLPMYSSNTSTAFPKGTPLKNVPSVSDGHQYSSPSDSRVLAIPELTPINLLSTVPYSLLKSPLIKQYQSPTTTSANMPLYLNYKIMKSSPKFPTNGHIINTAKPIKGSTISASESSPLSHNSLDIETVEEIEPYELKPDLKDSFTPLLPRPNQQSQFHPAFTSKYETSKPKPFSRPSFIPEEAELIDTTGFIPMPPIYSESLLSDYSSIDGKAQTLKTPTSVQKPDNLELHPFTTLSKSDFPPPTYKQLPPTSQTPRYYNQIPQNLISYISPQEYKVLTQGLSPSQASSSSSPIALTPTNTRPQLTISPLTGKPLSVQQIPFYTSPMSVSPENRFKSLNDPKYLPFYQKPIEETPDKYRSNKITLPRVNNYPYEQYSSPILEVPSELDPVEHITALIKSKEPYTKYIEDLDSSGENDYEFEPNNVSLVDKEPECFEAESFTKSFPEIIKGSSVPNDNKIAQRSQRLSKLDHFYENNHIGKSLQVFNVPTYNNLPKYSPNDVKMPSSSISPDIYKDFTNIPTKYTGTVPELVTSTLRPNANDPEIARSLKAVPTMKPYPQNYLNPCLKPSTNTQFPPTTEFTDTSDMPYQPSSYTPNNKIEDIKYSGYKTYQIPSRKSGTPTQIYSPYMVPYSPPIHAATPSNVQQNSSTSHFYEPTEMFEALTPQYQIPAQNATPLQTKLGLDTSGESSELDETNLNEDVPLYVDSTNEDNELKTSLINYINKKEDFKRKFDDNNAEVTIPLGNVAITRKEPCNTNTIEINNPSIGLKIWKSNVKIAQADLKLKFKDLSANNFMPVVNNLDRYDVEQIRKLVKNYIDEKYGKHIEVNEPYTVDNKYTIIKDFDHNAVDTKYNLLWPTNYV